jgi:hypothetical protein
VFLLKAGVFAVAKNLGEFAQSGLY